MNNRTIRPEIVDENPHIEKYDTIFLGAPIWWGVFPCVNTFLEKYNFDGKRIILFATSGLSPLGDTKAGLQPSAKGATIIEVVSVPILLNLNLKHSLRNLFV